MANPCLMAKEPATTPSQQRMPNAKSALSKTVAGRRRIAASAMAPADRVKQALRIPVTAMPAAVMPVPVILAMQAPATKIAAMASRAATVVRRKETVQETIAQQQHLRVIQRLSTGMARSQSRTAARPDRLRQMSPAPPTRTTGHRTRHSAPPAATPRGQLQNVTRTNHPSRANPSRGPNPLATAIRAGATIARVPPSKARHATERALPQPVRQGPHRH